MPRADTQQLQLQQQHSPLSNCRQRLGIVGVDRASNMVRITNRRVVTIHGDPSISNVGDPQTNRTSPDVGASNTLQRAIFFGPSGSPACLAGLLHVLGTTAALVVVFIGRWRPSTVYKQSMCHAAKPHGSGNVETFQSRHWTVSSMRTPGSGRFRPIGKSWRIEGLIRPYNGEPGEEAGKCVVERLIEARTSGAAIARRAGWIDRQGRQCCLRLEADLAIGQPAGAHLHTHQ